MYPETAIKSHCVIAWALESTNTLSSAKSQLEAFYQSLKKCIFPQ